MVRGWEERQGGFQPQERKPQAGLQAESGAQGPPVEMPCGGTGVQRTERHGSRTCEVTNMYLEFMQGNTVGWNQPRNDHPQDPWAVNRHEFV